MSRRPHETRQPDASEALGSIPPSPGLAKNQKLSWRLALVATNFKNYFVEKDLVVNLWLLAGNVNELSEELGPVPHRVGVALRLPRLRRGNADVVPEKAAKTFSWFRLNTKTMDNKSRRIL